MASAFDLLHPEIQKWIRDQGWQELRDIQDQAIRTILGSEGDALIAASTAAGKTEAAFLPILTRAAERAAPGLSVLYVSPLKALINDQFRRLDLLCERMEIDVVRWHGDAPQSAKARTLRDPRGVALITPESIEAMLLRRTADARNLFGSLDFIVVDELHAFLQGARGLHLASLLRRIDGLSDKRARRIGLSATIGDLAIAANWLNPSDRGAVQILQSKGEAALSLQIRGYVDPPGKDDRDDLEAEGEEPDALDQIADHAFSTLRGDNNLFFGGSRRTVEALADRLRRRSEAAHVPNEFYPHHGSLSKDLREELELRLKQGDLPTTAVATTTLELGVDIGSVKSVAVYGAPRSLSSLRQRLGRSGRRQGVPAILRIYVREPYVTPDSDPLDRLRLRTVRAVAAVRLLAARFIEPASNDPSLYSVLVHQTLSLIVERGGARASALHAALCGPGPFSAVSAQEYATLLRGLASPEANLIEQAPDGTIMLGEGGEKLVGRRDFYAVFETNEEWRLVAAGRPLGTIPLANNVVVGGLLAFAGQRWRITSVDDHAKVLEVELHRAGKLPVFDRLSMELIHDRLAEEMQRALLADDIPAYLDKGALSLLLEARSAFSELGLGATAFLSSADDTHILTWRGTLLNSVLAILLKSAGLECEAFDVGVSVEDATPAEIREILSRLKSFPSAGDLSGFVANLRAAKFDDYVPEDLLRLAWARRSAEICASLPQACAKLIES